jgi:hypothetical protein
LPVRRIARDPADQIRDFAISVVVERVQIPEFSVFSPQKKLTVSP